MKLVNLNIGINIDNNNTVLDFLEIEKADIVTLQEVMRKIDNSVYKKYDSSNVIRDNLDYKYSFFGPLWVGTHHHHNNVVTKGFGIVQTNISDHLPLILDFEI